MDSLGHPWFTTTNPSYRFPIFETSAAALCGTAGRTNQQYDVWVCLMAYLHCLSNHQINHQSSRTPIFRHHLLHHHWGHENRGTVGLNPVTKSGYKSKLWTCILTVVFQFSLQWSKSQVLLHLARYLIFPTGLYLKSSGWVARSNCWRLLLGTSRPFETFTKSRQRPQFGSILVQVFKGMGCASTVSLWPKLEALYRDHLI